MTARREIPVFVSRGPEAFKLLADEIAAGMRDQAERFANEIGKTPVHTGSIADSRRSELTRRHERQEQWLIHQAAPTLIDDRPQAPRPALSVSRGMVRLNGETSRFDAGERARRQFEGLFNSQPTETDNTENVCAGRTPERRIL